MKTSCTLQCPYFCFNHNQNKEQRLHFDQIWKFWNLLIWWQLKYSLNKFRLWTQQNASRCKMRLEHKIIYHVALWLGTQYTGSHAGLVLYIKKAHATNCCRNVKQRYVAIYLSGYTTLCGAIMSPLRAQGRLVFTSRLVYSTSVNNASPIKYNKIHSGTSSYM